MLFDSYSRYYDLLYHDKDYESEVSYVINFFNIIPSKVHIFLNLVPEQVNMEDFLLSEAIRSEVLS